MGRITRKCKGKILDSENISPHTLKKPTSKVIRINKQSKPILGDRTNIRENNKRVIGSAVNLQSPTIVLKKCEPVVNNDCKSVVIDNIPMSSKVDNSLITNDKKENKAKTVTNQSNIAIQKKITKNNKLVNKKITKEKKNEMKTKVMDDSEFYGFEQVEFCPLLKYLMKYVEEKSKLKMPSKINSNHLPVYKITKSSPIITKNEDLLNLYEFEIDENEPVKKTKRKPILKMGSKKFRTYKKKKKKSIGVLSPLNLSNQENICPNIQAVKMAKVNDKDLSEPKCVCSPKKNNSISILSSADKIENSPFNISIDNNIEDSVVGRQDVLYSPQPYESPNRDSLVVPILRPSIPQNNESSRSLNSSAYSSKCNTMINSPFSAHFGSPFYNGASTPIYKHWSDQTNNATPKKFDISNCFGFDESVRTEEPFVSPIKTYSTPGKTPVRVGIIKKPSPIRMPHNQVIRMLKFGHEADGIPDDNSVGMEVEELLPEDFFHEGDTPPYEYSPKFMMRMPLNNKRTKKTTNKGQKKKKKVVINDSVEICKDEKHSIVQDGSNQEPDLSEVEPVLHHNRTTRARSRFDMENNLILAHAPVPEAAQIVESESDIEVDISSFEQTTKKARRSYERPMYMRTKKYDDVPSDDDYEPEAVQDKTLNTPAKTRTKKRNEPSKKDKMELEKWAKAFNDQCMQVESFSLVVEKR